MTYALLLQCYRSGQITPAQWQQHLRDEVFAAWLKRHRAENAQLTQGRSS